MREANLITRANPRPDLAIGDGYLYYFVDVDHTLETALALVHVTNRKEFASHLADALSWLVASKALHVMNESTLSGMAAKQYSLIIENMK